MPWLTAVVAGSWRSLGPTLCTFLLRLGTPVLLRCARRAGDREGDNDVVSPRRRRRWWWSVSTGLLLVLALGAIGLALHSSLALARFERVQVRRAALIYAAPQPLASGLNVRLADLAGTLARLKYVETRGAPAVPGQLRERERRRAVGHRALRDRGSPALMPRRPSVQ